MTSIDRMLDILPAPYSIAGDSLVYAMLNVCALEVEAIEEDIDRLRRSHWVEQTYRDRDLDALASLVDVRRFAGEPSPLFRQRLLALVKSRLAGTITVGAIEAFVYDYLRGVENELECMLVTGLRGTKIEKAWSAEPSRPLFRNLELREFPRRVQRSRALADRGGAVTHLFRWTENNHGVDEAPLTFAVSGAIGGGTMMPMLIDVTSMTLYGWRGVVPFGWTLVLDAFEGNARATLEGADVTDRFFSIQPFAFGVRFDKTNMKPAAPPLMRRGASDWLFATIGFYDARGYDRVHFVIDDPRMSEAVFDKTYFDLSLFPSGNAAWIEMTWIEREAASFQLRVPRTIVDEPRALIEDFVRAGASRPPHEEIADDLAATIPQLRGAGIRTEVFFDGFVETQRQRDRFELSWLDMPPERASAGENDMLVTGARFNETSLGRSRFN